MEFVNSLDVEWSRLLERTAMVTRKGLWWLSLAAGIAVVPCAAQEVTADTSRVERGRAFRIGQSTQDQTALVSSPFSGDEAPASPGDPDLGEQVILKRREKATPFRLSADVSGFYTSNAALTDVRTVDDFYLVGQVGVTYQTRIANDLAGEITLRQAAFRYAELSDLDFESLNLGAGLTYIVRPLWGTAVSARYNYNRLTDGSEHQEFFKNQTLTLSLFKSFELSKAHYIYAGYSSIFGWSDPVAPQRDEHGFFLGYRANLTRSVSTELFYRIAVFDYVGGRDDLNQVVGLSVSYSPTKWLSLSTSASGGFNRSDREILDYRVFNAGLTIYASITF